MIAPAPVVPARSLIERMIPQQVPYIQDVPEPCDFSGDTGDDLS
jgi:hypothetical protein